MSSIVIQDVSKTFETKDGSVHALKNVSLSIESETSTESLECPVQVKVPWYAV